MIRSFQRAVNHSLASANGRRMELSGYTDLEEMKSRWILLRLAMRSR
jgi:hypothetical protein